MDTILSQYEFLDIVGQGGMGAVYKARQTNLDRLVAIKVLPPVLEEPGMNFAERFKREARAMAKLNHSNIVSVYDFGATGEGQLYFVMEFVEGTDLHQIEKSRAVTQDEVLEWFPRICDALQYAHAEGIIHRDIKPSNIMINQRGNVKVADFGLAKFSRDPGQTRLTMTNVTMGSPDYVAPESLDDNCELDSRADLYAVGVMLYEMLTGSVPRGAWRPPSQLRPGEIDPRFDDIVIEAMDPNRDSRFQEASEISERLFEIRDNPAPASQRSLNLATGPVPIQATGPVAPKAAPGSGGHRKQRLITGTGPVRPKSGAMIGNTSPIPPPASGRVAETETAATVAEKDVPRPQDSGIVRLGKWLKRRFKAEEKVTEDAP